MLFHKPPLFFKVFLTPNVESAGKGLFTSEHVSYSMMPGKAINRNDFLNGGIMLETARHKSHAVPWSKRLK